MEDDLKKNGRRPQIKYKKRKTTSKNVKKMEDDLKKINGRQPQHKFKKWKTTSIFIFLNGRRPQKIMENKLKLFFFFFFKLTTT